ncbi:MAG: TadE/TadG family type IV pilus assembly protein [Planctomycetota bacterium JB042]
MDERRLRRLVIHLLLFAGAVLSLRMSVHAETVVGWLRLDPFPWTNRIGTAGIWLTIGFAVLLLGSLGVALWRRGREWREASTDRSLVHGESGTAMVEFCLVFPIIAFLMALVFQMALLANASIVVRYAAWAGARAAIVRIDGLMPMVESIGNTEKTEVAKVVKLITATLSPASSQSSNDLAAENIFTIMKQQKGKWGDKSYRKRYVYADAATKVTTKATNSPMLTLWQIPFGNPNEAARVPLVPKQAEVRVDYDFFINMPGVAWLTGQWKQSPNVSGVSGSVYTITKIAELQGTGSRGNMLALFATPGATIFDY